MVDVSARRIQGGWRAVLALGVLLALQLSARQASGQGLLPSTAIITGSSDTRAALRSAYASSRAWRIAWRQAPARACSGTGLCAPRSSEGADHLAALTVATSPLSYRSASIPPAGDQGNCNSCTAFAVTAAASAAIAAVHRTDPRQASFSAASLFYCAATAGGPVRNCQGAGWSLTDALADLSRRHAELPTDACHPWFADEAGELAPQALCKPPCTATNSFTGQGTFSSIVLDAPWMLMRHIRRYGAVISTFELWSDLRAWGANRANARAVYTPRDGAQPGGRHAVLLVGYELYEDGSGSWLVLNSWGSGWGDNGLFKVAFDAPCVLAPGKGEAYGVIWTPSETPRAALLAVTPAPGRRGCYEYQARAGDYLSGVAWQARVDLAQLVRDNTARVKDPDAPLAGTKLLLCNPAKDAIRDASVPVDPQLEALLAIKAAVDGDNKLTDWTPAGGYCSWAGVTCKEGTQVVFDITLNNNNVKANALRGALPPASVLKGLPGLTSIDISDQTGITGPVPADWSQLAQLDDVRLPNNSLAGPLPPSWSALTRLKVLSLWGNQLSGTLPDSWRALAALEELGLSENKLSGPLPPSWSALTRLKVLSLWGNQLSGTLPDSWRALAALEDLQLSNNKLTGPLPPSWSALTRLKVLYLWGNQLSGTLPDSWRALAALKDLQLSNNKLTGPLPPSWSALTRLKVLQLQDNQLSGTLPDSWRALAALEELKLETNKLTGPLPPSWSALTRLKVLWTGDTQLSGPLPDSWKALTAMEDLGLEKTQLEGRVPASWSSMAKLKRAWLHGSARLSGCLPASWEASLGGWDAATQALVETQFAGFC